MRRILLIAVCSIIGLTACGNESPPAAASSKSPAKTCEASSTSICLDDGTSLELGESLEQPKLDPGPATPGEAPQYYHPETAGVVPVYVFGVDQVDVLLAVDDPKSEQSRYFPSVRFGMTHNEVEQAVPNAKPGKYRSAPALIESGHATVTYYIFEYCGGDRKLQAVILAYEGELDQLGNFYGSPCDKPY